jgi:hypothetical protein
MEPSSENVDMTMYLDQLYKIRNALEIYMRNNAGSDEMVSYGGVRYKRRSKRSKRTKRNKHSKRTKRNKRNKRSKRNSRRR